MRRIFSMVSVLTRRLLRSARETVEWETPASRATSLIEAGLEVTTGVGSVWLSGMHTFPQNGDFSSLKPPKRLCQPRSSLARAHVCKLLLDNTRCSREY